MEVTKVIFLLALFLSILYGFLHTVSKVNKQDQKIDD